MKLRGARDAAIRVHMEPTRNLLIIHSPGHEELSDWTTVAERIRQDAPDIDVRLGCAAERDIELANWQISRPSLFFSAATLFKFWPLGGKTYYGRRMLKKDQIDLLAAAGFPVPRTLPLIPGLLLSKAVWGDYVIVKPNRGAHGFGTSLAKTEDVPTHYIKLRRNDPRRRPMIVQQFIDHTDEDGHLVDYRALMMFGEPLYVHRRRATTPRPPLAKLASEFSGLIASNAVGSERRRELVSPPDVIEVAREAARAFSYIPVLGVDIVQCRQTGRYFVLEVNPGGTVWHFSSDVGKRQFDEATRIASYKQFDALATAARLLIERTRAEAK